MRFKSPIVHVAIVVMISAVVMMFWQDSPSSNSSETPVQDLVVSASPSETPKDENSKLTIGGIYPGQSYLEVENLLREKDIHLEMQDRFCVLFLDHPLCFQTEKGTVVWVVGDVLQLGGKPTEPEALEAWLALADSREYGFALPVDDLIEATFFPDFQLSVLKIESGKRIYALGPQSGWKDLETDGGSWKAIEDSAEQFRY